MYKCSIYSTKLYISKSFQKGNQVGKKIKEGDMARSRRGHFLVLLTHFGVTGSVGVSHHIYLDSRALLWPTTCTRPLVPIVSEREISLSPPPFSGRYQAQSHRKIPASISTTTHGVSLSFSLQHRATVIMRREKHAESH
jgi:hypothetical protein